MPFLLSTQEQLANFRDAADSGVAMVHVDTCLGCYLQDHHNRDGECLFGVYVDGATTVAQVKDMLRDEVRQTGDRVPDEVPDEMIYAAIEATFDGVDPAKLFAPSLEVPDEDAEDDGMESCQAWFVLTWQVPEDGDILGFNPESGLLIQWNGDDKERYESETPDEFGLHNISEHEFAAMRADGWKGGDAD